MIVVKLDYGILGVRFEIGLLYLLDTSLVPLRGLLAPLGGLTFMLSINYDSCRILDSSNAGFIIRWLFPPNAATCSCPEFRIPSNATISL